jgi:hypothetical protein
VDMLPENIRKHIDKRLRDNTMTLDQLIADLQLTFTDQLKAMPGALPSRSALGRKKQGMEEMIKGYRETQAVAEVMVAELGENFDDKSGPLMVQLLTTLTTQAAFGKLNAGGDEMEIKELLDLAKSVKAVQESRSLSLRERQAIAREAREKLLEEQREKLNAMGSKGGVTEDTKKAIREALGIV